MLDFGRGLCSDLEFSGRREWLVTNGIGGYAAGTLAGMLTRRYHGLLVAALQPPVGRVLLLAKLDETATYGGRSYPLFTNRWSGDEVEPEGYLHLERFHLEGTTPVWTFALADALLEKRLWMEPGANTTYVRYDLRRASRPLGLKVDALVDHRDHHAATHVDYDPLPLTVEHVAPGAEGAGLRITAGPRHASLYLLSAEARATLRYQWYYNFRLSVEEYRGLDPLDDNLYVGFFQATLEPGGSLTLVASTEPRPSLDGGEAYARRQAHEEDLLARATAILGDAPPAVRHLVLAADQFIVRRALPPAGAQPREAGQPMDAEPAADGRSILAGYPWFSDWGRDTMISLPGLTLAAGRPELAARILRTYARYVDGGMLPNRFPDAGEAPEYNTVDATLWYFEALRAYHAATGDDDLLRELFPVLQEIVACHRQGTRYHIGVDPADGLLYAGEEGVQLTWMDAKVDDWVVTPRIGKPVEINALWYNALRVMSGFAQRLGQPAADYQALAQRALAGFVRFWNEEAGYCYDVLDGPGGDDARLRPNQLFAVSLPHSPLGSEQQRAIVDVCAAHLLTGLGLRSLAPGEPGYQGVYGGKRRERDGAYHQGTVWGWLIGPFVAAHLRVYGDAPAARSFLRPLLYHLDDHCVGSLSEIFDGDAPFRPRGCFAQAWTVAEVLRAWQMTGEGSAF
ncbi:MAG: amylo-alpha-1,6-glucosidase [Anaerolineae bacterium]